MSEILDAVPINWGILKVPENWFVVILMLMIASFLVHVGLEYHSTNQGDM
jgi:hypothetical protein